MEELQKNINVLKEKRQNYTRGECMREAGQKLQHYNEWNAINEQEIAIQQYQEAIRALEDPEEEVCSSVFIAACASVHPGNSRFFFIFKFTPKILYLHYQIKFSIG